MHKSFSKVAGLLAFLLAVGVRAAPPPDQSGQPVVQLPPRPAMTELTGDLVYSVLVGEIALQRGDHRMAFTHFLHGARLASDAELAELAARAALAHEDADAAKRATDLWLSLDPDSRKARQMAVYVTIETQDEEATLAQLRELLGSAPSLALGYAEAARLLRHMPDALQRLAMMQRLLEPQADDADAQYALATLAAAAEDYAKAKAHAERALELRPGWNTPRLFLIRVLMAGEDEEQALAYLDKTLAEDPDDEKLLELRAQFHIEAEEYQEALTIFYTILAQAPDNADVLSAAAVLAMEVEDYDQARDYLQRIRKTGERDDDSAFLLGQLEQTAGNDEDALRWYGRVRGPNESDAEVRIAGLLAKRGEMSRAREILQQLRDQHPTQLSMLYLIEGELLREQGQAQAAIALYGDALERVPGDADLLYARAMTGVREGNIELLEQDLRSILKSDPEHADALNALGYTLAEHTDRLDEAKELIAQALALQPDEPAILDSMGWVLFRLGDAVAAEPYLRRALEAMLDGEIAAHLGEVLWAQGREAEAREVWRRAFTENPKHEYLLRILAKYGVVGGEQ